ncbi:MAG: protein arginine kinase [Planctomycetota bacterium]|nr:protein arginine kinase [Planctomycetota bacterium]
MAYSPIDPQALAGRVGSWLQSGGPDADVVVSFRIRLARNLADRPFQARLDPDAASEICDELRLVLLDAHIDGETWWVSMAEGGPVLRQLLLERNLISRDLCGEEGKQLPGRAVAFGESETVSVMVNEEDHVRLQAMAAGFDPDLAWERAQVLDRYLEGRLSFAHSRELGYLTGCPTNVGTGLRASVMLHLPALGMVRKELEKVFNAAQRTGLAVRGMHGEGSRAAGDLYQISNQVTLGRTETQLVDDLRALVPEIVAFERQVRQLLLAEHETSLSDRVHRSLGLLQSARAMPTDGALAHLSNLRLGVHLGLIDSPDSQTLSELGVQVQKGHVHALSGSCEDASLLDVSERDKLRAGLLRSRLGSA